MSDKLNSSQWSQYWATGTITTFDGIFDNGYDGDIEAFWQSNYDLMRSGQTILDIGTGNGALIDLLSNHCVKKNKRLNMLGLDFADIQHLERKQYPNLNTTFLSETRIENSKIEDDSVDHIISQFAFEYSSFHLSIPELSRVLKKNGKVMLMMHSSNSKIFHENTQYHNQVCFCLNTGVIKHSLELIPFIYSRRLTNKLNKGDFQKAENLRSKINKSVYDIVNYEESSVNQDFIKDFVQQLSTAFKSDCLDIAVKTLKNLVIVCESYQLRLSDMLTVSLTETDLEDIVGLFNNNSIKIESMNSFYHNNKCYGRAIIAAKI